MKFNTTCPDSGLESALARQDWPQLVKVSRKLLRKKANNKQAHRYLGFALHKLHDDEAAVEAFSKAICFWPDDAELLLNYGQTLMDISHEFNAIPLLEKATKLRPEKYLTWFKLSQAHYRCQGHARGFECAKKMQELADTKDEKVNALLHLALHEREFGQVKEAIYHCQQALDIEPAEMAAHTNRMLFMLADPDVTAEDLRQAASQYAQAVEPAFEHHRLSHSTINRRFDEHLRVGFLSPDFRNHSVMYFMEGVLAQIDRRQYTVVAVNLSGGADAVAKRVKMHVDEFIDLANYPFDTQLEMLQQAKIDILIDLAGHTGNNGLALMACKTAPIQATWIGYPGSTGLSAIDYLITDIHTDPLGVEDLYSEKLLRLDSRLCVYRPLIRNPLYRYQPAYSVGTTPALINKYITFGSCNNLGKITDRVLSVWSKIINQVPNSKLLIEGKNFEKEDIVSSYIQRCLNLGLTPDQIILLPQDARNQYLTYHQIDIALDPFPLNGGTTSMDVLWMGVPLVAMKGRSFRDRLTTGILLNLGRDAWLASSEEEYISIACRLASDFSNLNGIRLNLRREVEQSILMREDIFCHRLGLSLRKIWIEWLSEQRAQGDHDFQQKMISDWVTALPEAWLEVASPGIGLKTGHRILRSEAHIRLNELLNTAKTKESEIDQSKDFNNYPNWLKLTEFCEIVLNAIPNEPLALACLAEVEHAFGHTDFSVTYLRYAEAAIQQSAIAIN
jgi:protein O-GlcNAc transferase